MADSTRTIHVETLTRVEGEGGLYIRLRGRQVEEVQLKIFEPPRLFEALLRGRSLEQVPDIVARILRNLSGRLSDVGGACTGTRVGN